MAEIGLNKELKRKWDQIMIFMEQNFNKKPDINAILFIIGVRELGQLPENTFTKEEKTLLMHIANCKIFSYSGYYEQVGINQKGFPVWKNVKPIPNLNIFEQENLIRQHIIEYFEQEEILQFNEI